MLVVLKPRLGSAQLSAADRTFATLTAQSNTYDVPGRRGSPPPWRSTRPSSIQTMIDDHTNLASQLRVTRKHDPQFTPQAGVGNNIAVPTLNCSGPPGQSSSSTYKAQMISSHTELQALFQQYVDSDKPNPVLSRR